MVKWPNHFQTIFQLWNPQFISNQLAMLSPLLRDYSQYHNRHTCQLKLLVLDHDDHEVLLFFWLGTLPTNTNEIHLTEQYERTSDDKRFKLFDTNDDDRIIAFCSDAGLQKLSKCDQWHVDGTFKSAPVIYYQLFIIHGFLFGFMFPCCYILVKNKDYNCYKKVFENLKEHSGMYELKPKRITCDFELALIKSLRFHFPNADIKGCLFHFGQCIWKTVSVCGFKKKYNKDEEFKLFVKKLIALALVPIDNVVTAFHLVEENLPTTSLIATDKIINYFQSTWLNGSYSLDLWNHSTTIGPRTNNHVEGFHLKFNFKAPHPHIFKLINVFKRFESTYNVKYKAKSSSKSKISQIKVKT